MLFMSKLGNKNFALLGRMLDITQSNHRVIAGNISNVNTPSYQRRKLNFKESLRYAMDAGTVNSYRNIEGWVSRPNTTPVRNNGNNVDIDQEMLQMRENSSYYKVLTDFYVKKSQLVKKAIKGGV